MSGMNRAEQGEHPMPPCHPGGCYHPGVSLPAPAPDPVPQPASVLTHSLCTLSRAGAAACSYGRNA